MPRTLEEKSQTTDHPFHGTVTIVIPGNTSIFLSPPLTQPQATTQQIQNIVYPTSVNMP